MIYKFLKLIFRNALKHKLVYIISLFGLIIGFCFSILAFYYINYEIGYERMHENRGRISRLACKVKTPESEDRVALLFFPIGPELKENFPEIAEFVRFRDIGRTEIRVSNEVFEEDNYYLVDESVFKVFSYKFLQGNSENALDVPGRVVLSYTLAKKYFGTQNSIGKTILINKKSYEVTGVIEDIPSNSDLKIQALVSFDNLDNKDWFDQEYYTFLMFNQKSDNEFVKQFEKKMEQVADTRYNSVFQEQKMEMNFQFYLQSLTSLHFQDEIMFDTPKGNPKLMYTLGIVTFLILMISIFNYINLFISQSIKNRDQTAIMMFIGCDRKLIVFKFIIETAVIFTIAFIVAFIIALLLVPSLNNFAFIKIDISHIFYYKNILIIVLIIIVLALISTIYQSVFLSSYSKISNFKEKNSLLLRKVFLGFQFLVSIIMIVGALVISSQITFMKNMDTGLDLKNVYLLNLDKQININKLSSFKSELMKYPEIEKVSLANENLIPFLEEIPRDNMSIEKDTTMVETVVNFLMIDDNFLDLLKIDLIAGNNFSNRNVQGDNNGIIINERMVKTMGLKKPEDAIGKRINFMFNGKVIGVVKDFNYESLNFDLEPLVLVNSFGEEVLGTFMIKTKNVKSVKKIWLDYFPDNKFEYQSYTDFYNNLYKKDQKNMKLIIYLTLITILLSCSGLFAMSAYTFQIKLKEFGIRKIFGADKGNLALAFLKTFSVPILVSLIIAVPLSFEIANRWLQTYSYRIELTICLFVISIIISVLIFGVVVSYYIIKTFKMNPIDTIR